MLLFTLTPRATSRIALLAGLVLAAPSYGAESSFDFSAPGVNPYQQRRLEAREHKAELLEKEDATPAPTEKKPEAEAPLKVSIPNLNQSRQQRHPSGIALKEPTPMPALGSVGSMIASILPHAAPDSPPVPSQPIAAAAPPAPTPLLAEAPALPVPAAEPPVAAAAALPAPTPLPADIAAAPIPVAESHTTGIVPAAAATAPTPPADIAAAPPLSEPPIAAIAPAATAPTPPADLAAAPTEQPVAAAGATPPDPVIYHSPEPIIQKETLHMAQQQPEMLATLAPAAGGDAPSTPLIPLPDPLAPPVMPPPPPVSVPDATPITPPPPVAGTPTPAPAPAPVDPKELLQSLDTKAPVEETIPEKVAPIDTPVKHAKPPVDDSEPKEELSTDTQTIIKRIKLPKSESQVPDNFAIDHSKDMKDLFKDNPPSVSSVRHDAMGIAIEVKTPKLDANYELQRAYDALTSGQSSEAIEIYKTVLANDPNNTNALFGLATCYHRAGLLNQARPLYARLLAIEPNNRDGMNNFLVLLADEAPQDALTQLETLEAKNPGFSPIPAQMAVIYEKLGNRDKAGEKMIRAVELAPENLTYRYNLAIMLDKEHKYDEAAKLYLQLVEAWERGEVLPGPIQEIQQRLTFIRSNR